MKANLWSRPAGRSSMLLTPVVFALAVGCGGDPDDRGEKPVVDIEQNFLESPDQQLGTAVIEVPFEAQLVINGGDPPYTWSLPNFEKLPGGLSLSADGIISGVPYEAGVFEHQVIVSDSAGRDKWIYINLQVQLAPTVLACGETVSGSFPGVLSTVPTTDFSDFDNLEWIGLVLDADTTRAKVIFDNAGTTTTYLERAGEVPGSNNLDEHYVGIFMNPDYSDMEFAVDAGTVPTLSGYASQPFIPLMVASQEGGAWSATLECSNGPIFHRVLNYPTEEGTELEIDYDVYGVHDALRIWTDDPLPEWMNWDESTGQVTGIAEEAGTWEFTVKVENGLGEYREEQSIIGVYDVTDVDCNSQAVVNVEESYYEGDFVSFYDPKGYKVFRIPLTEEEVGGEVSEVDVSLGEGDNHVIGLAEPDPGWWKFYMGADATSTYGTDAFLTVDPITYPDIRYYDDAGDMYIIAASTGAERQMQLSVACDTTVRPDFPGLPVFQPFIQGNHQLQGIGGTEPYTWEASGLPAGVELTEAGVLQGTVSAIGTETVDVTITDANGDSFTESFAFHQGTEAACAGYEIVQCEGTASGTFTASYFGDNNGPASTRVMCMVYEVENNLGYTVNAFDIDVRMDMADPGATAQEMFDDNRGTYLGYTLRNSSEGFALNPWGWPNAEDYANLPVLFSLRAADPGDWSSSMTCVSY